MTTDKRALEAAWRAAYPDHYPEPHRLEALEAAITAYLAALPTEAGAPLTYAQIIDIVNDCSERMKAAGEGHRMLAKWISEGINSALATSTNPKVEP